LADVASKVYTRDLFKINWLLRFIS
jgi:hypothetical protein